MFFKTLKHDFISTGRIMGVIYLLIAGFSAVTLISHYANKSGQMSIGEVLGVGVLVVICVCLFVLTSVIVLVDFHKTLYGEQGYLTFTLPVKSWKILLSKVMVSSIWFVIALAAFFASMWMTVIVFKDEYLGTENYDIIMELFEGMSTKSISGVVATVIVRIILFFVEFAFFTITVFFTSTIANTRVFQKHSIVWTIVLFLPIAFAAHKIAAIINDNIVFSLFYADGKMKLVTDNVAYQAMTLQNYSSVDIASLFVYLVFGAALFFSTHYLMSKKINIR